MFSGFHFEIPGIFHTCKYRKCTRMNTMSVKQNQMLRYLNCCTWGSESICVNCEMGIDMSRKHLFHFGFRIFTFSIGAFKSNLNLKINSI